MTIIYGKLPAAHSQDEFSKIDYKLLWINLNQNKIEFSSLNHSA